MKASYFKIVKADTVKEDAAKWNVTEGAKVLAEFWEKEVIAQPFIQEDKENLIVVCLDTKLNIIGWNLISVGTLNESMAHPREIMRPVILANSQSFILMHNHPSGDISPSQADRKTTQRIREAANLMQIPLNDHIIMGNGYYSFAEAGLI